MTVERAERRANRQGKKARHSKTMIFNALAAGLGALETANPGMIPHLGPVLMLGLPVVNAVLRVLTTQPIR